MVVGVVKGEVEIGKREERRYKQIFLKKKKKKKKKRKRAPCPTLSWRFDQY